MYTHLYACRYENKSRPLSERQLAWVVECAQGIIVRARLDYSEYGYVFVRRPLAGFAKVSEEAPTSQWPVHCETCSAPDRLALRSRYICLFVFVSIQKRNSDVNSVLRKPIKARKRHVFMCAAFRDPSVTHQEVSALNCFFF